VEHDAQDPRLRTLEAQAREGVVAAAHGRGVPPARRDGATGAASALAPPRGRAGARPTPGTNAGVLSRQRRYGSPSAPSRSRSSSGIASRMYPVMPSAKTKCPTLITGVAQKATIQPT